MSFEKQSAGVWKMILLLDMCIFYSTDILMTCWIFQKCSVWMDRVQTTSIYFINPCGNHIEIRKDIYMYIYIYVIIYIYNYKYKYIYIYIQTSISIVFYHIFPWFSPGFSPSTDTPLRSSRLPQVAGDDKAEILQHSIGSRPLTEQLAGMKCREFSHDQWVDSRENLQATIDFFMISMVFSCNLSLKPINWHEQHGGSFQVVKRLPEGII